MAPCWMPMLGSFASSVSAILFIVAFGTDWWRISLQNRASLFRYRLAWKVDPAWNNWLGGDTRSYSWRYICSDPFCAECERTNFSANCDSRPADVMCNNNMYSPSSWCDQMHNTLCDGERGWTEACKINNLGEFQTSCTGVTSMGGACAFVKSTAIVIGLAMGFSIAGAVISVFTWCVACRRSARDPSPSGFGCAISSSILLLISLVLGIAGVVLGYEWINSLTQANSTTGATLSIVAVALLVPAIVLNTIFACQRRKEDNY